MIQRVGCTELPNNKLEPIGRERRLLLAQFHVSSRSRMLKRISPITLLNFKTKG